MSDAALFAASPADVFDLVYAGRRAAYADGPDAFDEALLVDWREHYALALSAGVHEYAWHLFNGTAPADLAAALDGIASRCASATEHVQTHGGRAALREWIRTGGLSLMGGS